MGHATTLVSTHLSALLRRRAAAFAEELPRAVDGEPRAIHQARVASRRLREILPIVGVASGIDVGGLRRDVRKVTRSLGRIRELDVTAKRLRTAAREWRWPLALVERIERGRAADRADQLAATSDRYSDQAIARLLGDLDALVGRDDLNTDIRAANAHLALQLRRRVRRFTAALDRAGTIYAREQLHQVRIAAKKLRYTLEIVREGAGVPIGREIARVRALQTLLGDLHDLQGLQARILTAATQPGLDRSEVKAMERWQRRIETACRELHARFVRQRPALHRLAASLASDTLFQFVDRRPRRMVVARAAVVRRGARGARR
ncbi:MAG TPA: CHAD domain-containing protein [Vicinamibacterales bacterium]|nr:CHAD domain-containing protein [Vicinamibacterales bacterium]